MQLQYITKNSTGKIHLTDADSMRMVTLCGLFHGYIVRPGFPGTGTFIYGDETASGYRATCKTCQRVAGVTALAIP